LNVCFVQKVDVQHYVVLTDIFPAYFLILKIKLLLVFLALITMYIL